MNHFGNVSQRPPFRAHSTTPFTHELDKSSEIATDSKQNIEENPF